MELPMDYNKLDNVRRAIYGFKHLSTLYLGWMNAAFDFYTLYPYINLINQEARGLLFRKNLFLKLVPIFAKNLKITEIVKKIIGLDILSNSEGIGLIEEIAKALIEEKEAQTTLNKRINSKHKGLKRKNFYFCGLSHKIHNKEQYKPLKASTEKANGELIAVEAILNHINVVRSLNLPLYKTFCGSGITWLLSDFPYFQMTAQNKKYDGNVLGILMHDKVRILLEQSYPFNLTIGWCPYVRVSGIYKTSLSPQYPYIKVIDLAWIEMRRPESFDAISNLLAVVLKDQKNKSNAYEPWLDTEESDDLFLFLSMVQMCYASQKLGIADVRDDIRSLVDEAFSFLKCDLPLPLRGFYFPGK
jgi:hypothetical protein